MGIMARNQKAKKKEMFERIRSQFERKELFTKLILTKGEFVCKGEGNSLFHFLPKELHKNQGAFGIRVNVEGQTQRFENIIANFKVGEDRYFMQTSIIEIGDREMILIPDQIFQLQRREHPRIELDERIQRKITVIEHLNRTVFVQIDCLDLSVGGAKLAVQTEQLPVQQGQTLRIQFHIKNKWTFEAFGEVMHVRVVHQTQILGFKFESANKVLSNKLQMIMLELQRGVVIS